MAVNWFIKRWSQYISFCLCEIDWNLYLNCTCLGRYPPSREMTVSVCLRVMPLLTTVSDEVKISIPSIIKAQNILTCPACKPSTLPAKAVYWFVHSAVGSSRIRHLLMLPYRNVLMFCFNYSEQWCPTWCHSSGCCSDTAVGELCWLGDHPSSQRMGFPHSWNYAVQQAGVEITVINQLPALISFKSESIMCDWFSTFWPLVLCNQPFFFCLCPSRLQSRPRRMWRRSSQCWINTWTPVPSWSVRGSV